MNLHFLLSVQIDMVGKRLALQKRTIIVGIFVERISRRLKSIYSSARLSAIYSFQAVLLAYCEHG
jgi:hypothetical protein